MLWKEENFVHEAIDENICRRKKKSVDVAVLIYYAHNNSLK